MFSRVLFGSFFSTILLANCCLGQPPLQLPEVELRPSINNTAVDLVLNPNWAPYDLGDTLSAESTNTVYGSDTGYGVLQFLDQNGTVIYEASSTTLITAGNPLELAITPFTESEPFYDVNGWIYNGGTQEVILVSEFYGLFRAGNTP